MKAVRPFSFLLSAGLLMFSNLAGAQSLPDGPGKATFESVCSLCHTVAGPAGKQWTRPQWEAKVIEMLQEEQDVTAQERAAILEYLVATFKPGGKIYVNIIAEKDLQTLLDISAKDAQVIIRYREEKGAFKNADDLKKVPGLDSTKIDAKKDLLAF
jgi:competence protein ComEA